MWSHLFQVEKQEKLNSDILFGDVYIGGHLWEHDGLNVRVSPNSCRNSTSNMMVFRGMTFGMWLDFDKVMSVALW